MSVLHITQDNFEDIVIRSGKKVLLDFWASWCGPCRMVAPVIEEVAAQRPDLIVGKVNVDEENALAMEFGVSSIPTLVVLRSGEVLDQAIGYLPKEDILKLIDGT